MRKLLAVLYTGLALGANPGLAQDLSALLTGDMAKLTLSDPQPLPEAALVTLDDAEASLADHLGKWVVVNFWATWCAPCREEMPALAAAQQRHTDIGFLFVNQGETPEKVRLYLAGEGLALQEVWLDPASDLGRAISSASLPTTLFLDPQGRRVDAHTGVLSAASLQARVEALRRVSTR